MKLLIILTTLVASVAGMSQAEAEAKLEAAGIYASSSGGCTNRNNRRCTSYEGIRTNTVNGVITLKNACKCPITITGGTETGHADGTYSHWNGYKVDIRHGSGVDAYVKNTFNRIGNRGDGYPQWKSAAGNIYCDEGSHWDITYF